MRRGIPSRGLQLKDVRVGLRGGEKAVLRFRFFFFRKEKAADKKGKICVSLYLLKGSGSLGYVPRPYL